MNQPEKEYEYIHIETEEQRRRYEPKLRTDEMWLAKGKMWVDVDLTKEFSDSVIYRRRISPGEGFEIVGLDESLYKYEFDITRDGFKWEPCGLGPRPKQYTARDFIAEFGPILAIRRKLPVAQAAASAQPAPWIKFSERRPTEQDIPIQVWGKDNGLRSWDLYIPIGPIGFTHWRPLPADLPQPDKSPSELAFEKLFGPVNKHKSKWKGWVAREGWKGELK